MYTETSVVMQGPRERIFALGAAIEDWPIILPHYRSVRLTERMVQADGTTRKVATMKAWRLIPFGKIPVGWKTIQESNAATGLLHFVHIGGFTKGMDVYWHLQPEGDATRVTITHDFMKNWPLVGGFVAHRIVGQFFVDAIARRTLHCIKGMVEGEAGSLTPQPPLLCSAAKERGSKAEGRDRDGSNVERTPRHSAQVSSPLHRQTGLLHSLIWGRWLRTRGAGGEESTRD